MLGITGFAANIADVLNDLEYFGFFKYILPFLLIFAVVFAILEQIHIFKDKKGPAMIVSLAIGLLALQLDFVPAFFQQIFPNLGIGISILLAALILAGAFISDEKAYKWIFFALGALIFLIVVFDALSGWRWGGGWFWDQYMSVIIVLIVIIGAIAAVVFGAKVGGSGGKT